MSLDRLLYDKTTRIFKTFLDNAIEDREYETDDYYLSILDVKEEYVVMKVCVFVDAAYTISVSRKNGFAFVVIYEDSDDNIVYCFTEFGRELQIELNRRFKELLEYFENHYKVDVEFDNAEVLDFDVEQEESYIEDECDNEDSECEDCENYVECEEKDEHRKQFIFTKSKFKMVSVDRGMGKFIEKLNKSKVITMFSCIGHGEKQRRYVDVYCLDSDVDKIQEYINSFFGVSKKDIEVEYDNKHWIDLEDNRKHYTFRF